MTQKEMLTNVINGNITEEVKAKAKEMLATVNKSNKSSKTRTENLAIARAISEKLNNNTTYATSEILPLISADYPNITQAKISAVMKVGVEEKMFSVCTGYKVGNKGRGVNGYTKIADTEETTEETAEETAKETTEETTN